MSEHIQFARKLRREQTDVEAKLWSYLRGRRFKGLKFKRQVPIRRYVADFVCEAEKLVIEVDGWHHGDQVTYDEGRSRRLEEHGYCILRFESTAVRKDMDWVLGEILAHVGDNRRMSHLPSSAPSGHLLPEEKGKDLK